MKHRHRLLVLFVLPLLLVAAFLRFVWSNRVFGYCSVVMAAVPPPGDPAAFMLGLAASSGNRADMFEATARYLERKDKFRKSVSSAMI